jgi:hypothetical protein
VRFRRWLQPGIGVKRWLLLMFVGLLLLALGVAHLLRQLSVGIEPGSAAQAFVDLVTLSSCRSARGAVVRWPRRGALLYGAWRLARRSLIRSAGRGDADRRRHLSEAVPRPWPADRGHRRRDRPVDAAARLKEHTSNLTAIVTVADDGGSSGALREQLGIPPVGDIRNCIAALADAEPLMSELLGYRFPGFERAESGLVETARGSAGTRRQPAARGDDRARGRRLRGGRSAHEPRPRGPGQGRARLGDADQPRRPDARRASRQRQSTIMRTPGIERVWIEPREVRAAEDAIAAIADAEIVVLGPGSLYTSVLPVLLIPRSGRPSRTRRDPRLRCNVATQVGETEGFDLADHVEALVAHTAARHRRPRHRQRPVRRRGRRRGGRRRVRPRWPPTVERPAPRDGRRRERSTIRTTTTPSGSPPRSSARSSARARPCAASAGARTA